MDSADADMDSADETDSADSADLTDYADSTDLEDSDFNSQLDRLGYF